MKYTQVLNEDINQFDYLEKKTRKKLHSVKKWSKRIIHRLDAKLFETTYKDEYEKQNIQIDKMSKRITSLEKNNKTLMRKTKRLEKRLEKYEKEKS